MPQSTLLSYLLVMAAYGRFCLLLKRSRLGQHLSVLRLLTPLTRQLSFSLSFVLALAYDAPEFKLRFAQSKSHYY